MDPYLIYLLKKDKYYDYLKENSFFIKDLRRNIDNYHNFKDYIKRKYHLRISDKIEDTINSIELVSSVLDTLK